MELLLTILSVLAFWAFLVLLVVGLLLIFKTLESIRGRLERIAMGVRAIEQETMPLAARATQLGNALKDTAAAMIRLTSQLDAVQRDFETPGPGLRSE